MTASPVVYSHPVCSDAGIVVVDPFLEIFQILAPVIVGVSNIAIPGRVSSGCDVEVREIARIGKCWDSYNNEEDDADEDAEEMMCGWFAFMAFVKAGQCYTNEEIEKGENRKEVSKSDGEIAGDADVAVKENKENGEVFCDMVLERTRKKKPEFLRCLLFDGAGQAKESVASGRDEKEKKRECFLEEKDHREIPGRRDIGNSAEKVVDIAGSNAGKHFG